MKSFLLFTFFLALFLPFQSNAGWLITGRFIDREGNTIMKRYFIQNSEVKVERYNLIYTCNLKTENIIIVDPVNLVFVKTNLKDYSDKMKQIKLQRLSELLALIPEGQRNDYEKAYKAQVEDAVILPLYDGDSLAIKQLADTVKFLQHQTLKFAVSENGRKKEEFFFTNEVDISVDLNMNSFLRYVYLLEPEDKTIRYLNSESYLDLVKNGLVLRRFIFEDGYRSEWQVNQIEQKKIPEYEFGTPELCKELTLDKWLVRQKETDDKYYDDYE
jgi:hypothetical protein